MCRQLGYSLSGVSTLPPAHKKQIKISAKIRCSYLQYANNEYYDRYYYMNMRITISPYFYLIYLYLYNLALQVNDFIIMFV